MTHVALAAGLALAAVVATVSPSAASPWVSNGPVGGSVRAFAVDPTDPDVGTADAGGVFKTTDGGATWAAINTGIPTDGGSASSSHGAIVIDPTSPTTIYAALPLATPVEARVQLHGNGECWEASYSAGGGADQGTQISVT